MDYITAKQAAEKWQVSTRWVQIFCNRGNIPGAQRHGREWLIPALAQKPHLSKYAAPTQQIYTPMPLLNSIFAPGECYICAKSFDNADMRAIAIAEYYYFSGQAEKACELAEPYLDCNIPALQLSAYLIYAYSNLALGRTQLSAYALTSVMKNVAENCADESQPQLRAISVFIANVASVLLHLSLPGIPPMADALPILSPGLRFFACYIMAHQAYLDGDYSRSLGIADAAFAITSQPCPIPAIYLHLISAMDYMSLKRTDEGKAAFNKAWALARKDDLIEAFGERHGLLEGLVETCLKKDEPEAFERIIAITYSFSAGWRQIHNAQMKQEVAGNLTTTEFTIPMLANRGWSNQEIADHLNLSVSTVKGYISTIYQKLGISSRKDLKKYMLH